LPAKASREDGTVQLYIVRHGIAQPRGAAGVSCDAERALTPKGRRRTRLAAEGLTALGCRPERIGTSPLRRCEETAVIIADVVCPEAPVEVCEFLAPGAVVEDVLDWMGRFVHDSMMIVGHMPDVAEIASGLLSAGTGLDMVFKKAGACSIWFDGEAARQVGRLEWLLQPRHLCALAKGGGEP